jgi:chromosome segregation ATPase
MLNPLIKRELFSNKEDALQELLKAYILGQISEIQQEVSTFEQKYGMHFRQFDAYLHERSTLLTKNDISTTQRQKLGQAIMQEEDDWFDWKVAQEMLDNWLGLQREVRV